MIVASSLFATSTFLSKLLGTGLVGEAIHPLQVTHARFFVALIIAGLLFRFSCGRFDAPDLRMHVARSTLGYLGVAILFTAIIYIPAPDAVALIFLNPIFAMIFAVILLRERVGINRWSAAAVSFAGALFLIRPSGFHADPVALLCILGAVVMGLEITCIKSLSGREPVFQILFLSNLIAFCMASLPLAFVFTMPGPAETLALIGVGATMVSGQMLFISSMKRAESSLVTPYLYSTLIFVIALDFAVLLERPDMVSLLGSLIIVASGAFIAFREARVSGTSGTAPVPQETGRE